MSTRVTKRIMIQVIKSNNKTKKMSSNKDKEIKEKRSRTLFPC